MITTYILRWRANIDATILTSWGWHHLLGPSPVFPVIIIFLMMTTYNRDPLVYLISACVEASLKRFVLLP